MEHGKAQVQSEVGNEVCDVCGGTGWELYSQYTEIYDAPTEFARRCPKCHGWTGEDLTRTPAQFHDADLSKFDFSIYSKNMDKLKKIICSMFDDWEKWELQGRGVYLWSQMPGSGKTFLSCCIGKSIMIRYDVQMRFVTAPDYMQAVADSYKKERGEQDFSEIFRKCKLLILDDLGTQMSKEWQQQELFRLINERVNNGLVTIYTSNMPPEKLNLEPRTVDRIMSKSVVLQMPEESIRSKKAKERQDKFLHELGI